MGDYLEFDNKETNSKALSKILIDGIRFLDFNISEYNKDKFFKPEYYNENKIGCGSWVITLKGVSLLIDYLRKTQKDNETARQIATKNNKYYLENMVLEEEYEQKVEEFAKRVKDDIEWCINYLLDILINMIEYDKSYIDAEWV